MRLEIRKIVQCQLPVSQLNNLAKRAVRLYGSRLLTKELSLVIVDTKTMRRLNRIYRKKDTPTDVLSFDYGEIIINYPRARQQAREHGISLADELALLFGHGLLHILGFNHKRSQGRQKMARAEKRLLGYSGLISMRGIGKH